MSTSVTEEQRGAPVPAGRAPRVVEFGKGRQNFKWIDYEVPSAEQIDRLGDEYHFHPLTLEDAKNFDQRAKVESYGEYLFLSLHSLQRANGDIDDHELEVFLGRNYLITLHREPLELLQQVHARFNADARATELGPDYLLYTICDAMVDAIFPILDKMDDEIDELEDQVIDRATPASLQRIFHLKQQLIGMRRTVAPMRDVMNALAGTRFGLIDAQTALYFRDAYDHLARIHELIETARDLLGNALDTYLSVVSNRLNEVMKRLTIVSTIFLPISFIVGMGGMNFQQFPFGSDVVYWVLMASLVAVPVGMLLYFRIKGWS